MLSVLSFCKLKYPVFKMVVLPIILFSNISIDKWFTPELFILVYRLKNGYFLLNLMSFSPNKYNLGFSNGLTFDITIYRDVMVGCSVTFFYILDVYTKYH